MQEKTSAQKPNNNRSNNTVISDHLPVGNLLILH